MKITFLGVEGYPQGGRNTISILIEYEKYRILLDCGASIINQLDSIGMKANDINSVFVSHLHADHSSGLPLMLYSHIMERFEGRVSGAKELEILGNQEIIEPLITYCRSAYPVLFNNDNPLHVKLTDIPYYKTIQLNDCVSVKGVPMSHGVKGESLFIAFPSINICYTADTRNTDDIQELAKGADILICNVYKTDEDAANKMGFLSAVGASKLATQIGASKLIMLHLYDEDERNDAMSVGRQYYEGEIIVPRSGMDIVI